MLRWLTTGRQVCRDRSSHRGGQGDLSAGGPEKERAVCVGYSNVRVLDDNRHFLGSGGDGPQVGVDRSTHRR